MEEVVNLIGTLGFPIVMCGALFWKINRQDEDHKEEISKITMAVENNTAVIENLITQLGGVK